MRISVASYAFHGLLAEGKMDVFGYLETVKFRYHIDTADIWNGMLQSTDEDYLKKIREAMDEKEMNLANLCVDGAHVWEPDENARAKNRKNALANLKAAEILGAKTIRIDMGGRGLEMTDEQFDAVVKGYKEYASIAADCGIMVGPENHWGPSLNPANMVKVKEAVDSPAYGILLHIGHWDTDEENGDAICAPFTMHTHVAANVIPVCEEKIDMLLNAGYKGYWGVEHHSGKNEYIEVEWQVASVRRALAHLKETHSVYDGVVGDHNPILRKIGVVKNG